MAPPRESRRARDASAAEALLRRNEVAPMKWNALLSSFSFLAMVLALDAGARSPLRAAAATPETDARTLPRFTEEREAAALCFVKKHLPELAPLLEQLKKNNNVQYQH